MRARLLRACLLAAPAPALAPCASADTSQQPAAITWEPYTLRAGDKTFEFPLGRLDVPENHAGSGGPTIKLAFVKLSATTATPGPPIIYLAGGPGGSGIAGAGIPYLWDLFTALRAVGDVLLLDQRGTGRTQPSLACPRAGPAPLDLFESEAKFQSSFAEVMEACARQLRDRGVRPEHYTTPASADDIEQLRRALGVDKVSLLGFSYGTHLGLSAIRRHGDGIHRAVLAGVEGPEHNEKLPSVWDLQLERLAWYTRNDPTIGRLAPDLVATWREILERVDREPIRLPAYPDSGANGPMLVIGRYGLQYLLMRDLGDTNDWPILPGLIVRTSQGNLQLLGSFARRRWSQAGGLSLMGVAMDCASGASAERHAQVLREAARSYFGNAMNPITGEVCRTTGAADLGEDYRARFWSPVPTLFVSGTLDAQTPPHQAEEVRWGFPNGRHLVVEHSGHESTLDRPAVRELVVRFLSGEDVGEMRIVPEKPRFRGPGGE
ncbi:MAG TPA: alpha/beta fold hydrolase [Gemmatimonadales bacterium]